MEYEYGYDENYINQFIDIIRDSYRANIDALYTKFKTAFDLMGAAWYAPEAVTTAREIADRQSELCMDVYSKYKYIFDIVIIAAQKWANTVGETYTAPGGNDFGFPSSFVFDISAVQRTKDGLIAIVPDMINTLTQLFNDIKEVVSDNMSIIKSNITKSEAFMGANQMTHLANSVQQTIDRVNESAGTYLDLFDKKMKETMTRYKEVARNNAAMFYSAQSFSGTN